MLYEVITSDLVHDDAGGVRGAAAALQRPGRHRRGFADREPQPCGAGRPDRVFRQQPTRKWKGEDQPDNSEPLWVSPFGEITGKA